jgi:hypothetical protein
MSCNLENVSSSFFFNAYLIDFLFLCLAKYSHGKYVSTTKAKYSHGKDVSTTKSVDKIINPFIICNFDLIHDYFE